MCMRRNDRTIRGYFLSWIFLLRPAEEKDEQQLADPEAQQDEESSRSILAGTRRHQRRQRLQHKVGDHGGGIQCDEDVQVSIEQTTEGIDAESYVFVSRDGEDV